jgi:hypothetical protein
LKWQPVANPVSHTLDALRKNTGRNGVPEVDSSLGIQPIRMISMEDH